MHQYIEAPNYELVSNQESIFLAGGISGCKNWQNDLIIELKQFNSLTVFNPRREKFEMFKGEADYTESIKQIGWEYNHLRYASQVCFWFGSETLQPIALFELGASLERNKYSGSNQVIIIGCDPNYKRIFDVKTQVNLSGHATILESFKDFVYSVVVHNKNIERLNKK